MEKHGKLVIVGDGETAEMAFEYFTHDSPYEVTAFSVEKKYAKKEELFGLAGSSTLKISRIDTPPRRIRLSSPFRRPN